MDTREDLIIEMMPFSDELKSWCKHHPDFLKALKVVYPAKFISLQAVVTSYSPNYPSDEVIGVYAYAYTLKTPKFKQDFIVNKEKRNEEFTLYTRYPNKANDPYIKDINEFFSTYGKGGYYKGSHWITFEQLPDKLKPRAEDTIDLANQLIESGLRELTTKDIEDARNKLDSLKGNHQLSYSIPIEQYR